MVKDYDSGDFGPASPITREQPALMLYCLVGSSDVEAAMGMAGYDDAVDVPDWAVDAMRWAVTQAGIITDKDGGVLDPQGQASRTDGFYAAKTRFSHFGTAPRWSRWGRIGDDRIGQFQAYDGAGLRRRRRDRE